MSWIPTTQLQLTVQLFTCEEDNQQVLLPHIHLYFLFLVQTSKLSGESIQGQRPAGFQQGWSWCKLCLLGCVRFMQNLCVMTFFSACFQSNLCSAWRKTTPAQVRLNPQRSCLSVKYFTSKHVFTSSDGLQDGSFPLEWQEVTAEAGILCDLLFLVNISDVIAGLTL